MGALPEVKRGEGMITLVPRAGGREWEQQDTGLPQGWITSCNNPDTSAVDRVIRTSKKQKKRTSGDARCCRGEVARSLMKKNILLKKVAWRKCATCKKNYRGELEVPQGRVQEKVKYASSILKTRSAFL